MCISPVLCYMFFLLSTLFLRHIYVNLLFLPLISFNSLINYEINHLKKTDSEIMHHIISNWNFLINCWWTRFVILYKLHFLHILNVYEHQLNLHFASKRLKKNIFLKKKLRIEKLNPEQSKWIARSHNFTWNAFLHNFASIFTQFVFSHHRKIPIFIQEISFHFFCFHYMWVKIWWNWGK